MIDLFIFFFCAQMSTLAMYVWICVGFLVVHERADSSYSSAKWLWVEFCTWESKLFFRVWWEPTVIQPYIQFTCIFSLSYFRSGYSSVQFFSQRPVTWSLRRCNPDFLVQVKLSDENSHTWEVNGLKQSHSLVIHTVQLLNGINPK